MAKRASIATGNFTTAGTWGLIDATMYGQAETNAVVCPTAYSNVARSAQYTPGAITVSHIGVKLAVRTGTTGTITVHIASSTHVEIAGTAVTINTADLPVAATADANGGWHFFKLATPVALSAATLYEVEAKTSSASQVSLFASAATSGMSLALLQAATTGAPAAGDDLFIVGEYTGAGTSNSFTVTMDNTAATDFGSAPTAANSLLGPGLAICSKGTLTVGTTAATAYLLKMSNSIIVYSGGTWNEGTTGTPMPRDSSFVLTFDCGANVDYGFTVRNLGTLNRQGQSRTSGKLIDRCKLNTDEAANSTSLGVDTDTGWLDNDVIAVASTTRTAGQSEVGAMNGAAGASSLTVDGFAGTGGGILNAHSGTSPTQAEVILLTRNIRWEGASASLQAYVDIKATATVDCDWAEFKWLGSATANKRGVDVATTTGNFNMQYCSLHNFEVSSSRGLNVSSASGNNITFSNNVTFFIQQTHFVNVATSGNYTISDNIFIYNTSSATDLITLADIGISYTNNTSVSGTGYGLNLTQGTASIGTLSGCNIHSCTNGGLAMVGGSSGKTGTISSFTVWRCNATGIFVNVDEVGELIFDTFSIFGCNTASITFSSITVGRIVLESITSSGDSTFSTTNGIYLFNPNNVVGELIVNSCDFSTVTGIKTAHTNDINVSGNTFARILANNCILAGTNEVTGQSNLATGSIISSQKTDQIAGNHKTWVKYGNIARETTTVHTGSQSVKLTPNNASNKLEGPSFKIAVANGATLTPTVYVYEDASYNGARARLILKRNDAIGVTSDTVIDTATASSDAAWEALTGTTAAATDDGVMEFVIDCDGTAGNLFVDSFTVA